MKPFIKTIFTVFFILSNSGCTPEKVKGNPDNEKIIIPKPGDTSHPLYEQGSKHMAQCSKPVIKIVEKYKKAPFIPLKEVYADAALIARYYKAYVDNREWVTTHFDLCRAPFQDIRNTIYPKIKEMHPKLATIDTNHYLKKKQGTQHINASKLEDIKNIAIVEYAARYFWGFKKNLKGADEIFFQDNPASQDNPE